MYDLIVNAPNVRTGGGLVLMKSLVNGIGKLKIKCLLIVNEKINGEIRETSLISIKIVKHSIANRIKNEFYLRSVSSNTKNVLLFGNLPPIFNLKCHTTLYMQNAYIINNISLIGFDLKPKLRIILERLWFRFFWKKVNRFIVQTYSMKKLLSEIVVGEVEVCPFVDFDDNYDIATSIYDYIYPSSGEPHKNHVNLIKAWVILAGKGVYPTLCLTLDEVTFKKLVAWINKKVINHKLNIINIGNLRSHSEMLAFISRSKCMIFPSLLESFGLPLIEAKYFNIPILAPELDYVRDVVTPHQTFNAKSPTSISRSILRFMGEDDLIEVKKPEDFILKIL